MILKPSTQYGFGFDDLNIVLELAKVGDVHLLSHQVCLKTRDAHGIVFIDHSNNTKKCDGLKLPQNWSIESIYSRNGDCEITFGVKKQVSQ